MEMWQVMANSQEAQHSRKVEAVIKMIDEAAIKEARKVQSIVDKQKHEEYKKREKVFKKLGNKKVMDWVVTPTASKSNVPSTSPNTGKIRENTWYHIIKKENDYYVMFKDGKSYFADRGFPKYMVSNRVTSMDENDRNLLMDNLFQPKFSFLSFERFSDIVSSRPELSEIYSAGYKFIELGQEEQKAFGVIDFNQAIPVFK